MIKRYNNLSFLFGIPGFLLQLVGQFKNAPVFLLAGTLLFMIGLAFYAKAKGRHPAWCLMALLSIIGLIVLACLKDHEKENI